MCKAWEEAKPILMTEQKFLCKFCVQFEDHKGHDYHHIKVLMDNTLRKRRRLEKLLEESINARMKLEEEVDVKFGEIKEFIKNQFFEMRMVLHLREGEIVKNVESIYKDGKETIAGGYNENKKKWEAQIADISQTDFDFQAIAFMKEEHDNNDYESLILEAKRQLDQICIETQGILGRFLKTMDSLSLYPMAKNEVSTQTSRVSTIEQITQTIERFKITQEKETQTAMQREFECVKANEMTFGELVVEGEEEVMQLKEEVVQPKEEAPGEIETFFDGTENRDFCEEESCLDDVKVPMVTEENNMGQDLAERGYLDASVQMGTEESHNLDSYQDVNVPMIIEDKKNQDIYEKNSPDINDPMIAEDPKNKIKMEEEKEEEVDRNKEQEKNEIQVINVETYEAPDIIEQIMKSDVGARIRFDFANKEILEKDFVEHLCDEEFWANEVFGKVSHLEADFSGTALTDEQFAKFSRSVLAKLKNLTNLEINLALTKITNQGLEALDDSIGGLKSFGLNCSETGIGSEGLKGLKAALNNSLQTLDSLELTLDSTTDATLLNGKEFHEIFSQMTFLAHLKMSFEKSKISSQGISLLLSSISSITGSLESLDLNFNNTKIEDRSLEIFRTKIVPSMNKIKSLKLALGKTGLSNKIMMKFFQDLKDCTKGLTVFELDLHDTCLHNPVLAQFFKNTFKEMPGLQNFKLNLSRTKITHEGFKHFCLEAPNLKTVIVNLNETNINDQSLEILKKRVVLSSVKKLEFHLEKTFLSNQAIKELFDHIGKKSSNMECLNLNLAHTSVDNKSIKYLKDKVLPFMRYLGDLQINLRCTVVSQQNKDIKPLGQAIKASYD